LQYLVLTLGDAKEATPTINKSLNPEWNTTLEFPITGQQSLLLEACCWDKDRFGKDYMGEFDVILEDVFQNAQTVQEPKWFPLESRRSGKKKSVVTGEIQIQFSLVDASNPNASAEEVMRKFMSFTTGSPSPDEDDDEALLRSESAEMDGDNDAQTDDDDSSDEPLDESKKAEKREKRRKKLRMARLKRKASKLRAYEFSDKSEVAGVLFLEITKVTDLPPEKNGMLGIVAAPRIY
jgi:phosphatidylserine decarboxylase